MAEAQLLSSAAGAAGSPAAQQLSETDQFIIMLNVCAAVCGSFVYCLLMLRQRQTAGQRERYYPGPFVSLAEASQSWKVYRQCGHRLERDTHVCNFCGFAIKALPSDVVAPAVQEIAAEEAKGDSKAPAGSGGLKRRINKKGKKA
eukprot:TRINITY_DN17907_c0_g2_i1.p2 TRINITY_DN17907_c0_g2~~TRINITY_DN17907_c0_g2_i1.p2  ORF type:complete len:145 (-),score=33.72 TRINITY_DN17907_c0_g2_i1:50-484(-)